MDAATHWVKRYRRIWTQSAATRVWRHLSSSLLSLPELELGSLAGEFNRRLHLTFQNNMYSAKFAYHPKLMQVAKAQVTWVLEQLSKPINNQDMVTGEQYIYLSSMRVQDSVAMSNPCLCGVPSLTAIWDSCTIIKGNLINWLTMIPQLSFRVSLFMFETRIFNQQRSWQNQTQSPKLERFLMRNDRPFVVNDWRT